MGASVCPSATISQEHVKSSSNFVSLLPVAVARSSSRRVATCMYLCTSGFLDDVMSSCYGRNDGVSLLHGVIVAASCTG